MRVWDYLERLNHPGVRFINAARAGDAVYAEILGYLTPQLGICLDHHDHQIHEGAR
jgi:hypothetical protein